MRITIERAPKEIRKRRKDARELRRIAHRLERAVFTSTMEGERYRRYRVTNLREAHAVEDVVRNMRARARDLEVEC